MTPRVPGSYAGVQKTRYEECRHMHPACAECGGFCCMVAAIQPKVFVDKDELDVLRTRGVVVENDVDVGIIAPCKHYAAGKCLIYPNRPKYCREFEVGSEACQRVRALKGTL